MFLLYLAWHTPGILSSILLDRFVLFLNIHIPEYDILMDCAVVLIWADPWDKVKTFLHAQLTYIRIFNISPLWYAVVSFGFQKVTSIDFRWMYITCYILNWYLYQTRINCNMRVFFRHFAPCGRDWVMITWTTIE